VAPKDSLTPAFDAAASWIKLSQDNYPLLEKDGALAHAPVELDLGDTPAARENLKLVETALLILSQSRTGRDLLQAAKKDDYLIVVNPAVVGGAGAEHEADAQASADVESRLINLRCNADPLTLAMRIAHELAHVTQAQSGLMLGVTRDHPVSAIRQLLAQEADARAYEMKVAIELAAPSKDEPAGRITFPEALDAAAESVGNSFGRRIVEKIRDRVMEGTFKAENAMLAIFSAFYSSPSLRAHYEATILHGLEEKTAEELQCPQSFQRWTEAGDIIKALDSRGTYLAAAPAGYIDLDGAQMMSASPATVAKLKELESTRRENPATEDDRPWTIAAYQVAPANPQPAAPKPPNP
jgi:hypothetical protein